MESFSAKRPDAPAEAEPPLCPVTCVRSAESHGDAEAPEPAALCRVMRPPAPRPGQSAQGPSDRTPLPATMWGQQTRPLPAPPRPCRRSRSRPLPCPPRPPVPAATLSRVHGLRPACERLSRAQACRRSRSVSTSDPDVVSSARVWPVAAQLPAPHPVLWLRTKYQQHGLLPAVTPCRLCSERLMTPQPHTSPRKPSLIAGHTCSRPVLFRSC